MGSQRVGHNWVTEHTYIGSAAVAHRLTCSLACGIFPDQGSTLCPLHWQLDSFPLCYQGSPSCLFVGCFFFFILVGKNDQTTQYMLWFITQIFPSALILPPTSVSYGWLTVEPLLGIVLIWTDLPCSSLDSLPRDDKLPVTCLYGNTKAQVPHSVEHNSEENLSDPVSQKFRRSPLLQRHWSSPPLTAQSYSGISPRVLLIDILSANLCIRVCIPKNCPKTNKVCLAYVSVS